MHWSVSCITLTPIETCVSLVDPCSRARRFVDVRFVILRDPLGWRGRHHTCEREGGPRRFVQKLYTSGSGTGIRGPRLSVARRFLDAKLIPEWITSAACGVLVLAWTRLLDLREDQRTGPSRGTLTTWTSGEVDCLPDITG